MTTPSLHTPDPQRAARTPYAGPVADASVGQARPVSAAEPYVPAPLRSRPVMQAVAAMSLPQHTEQSVQAAQAVQTYDEHVSDAQVVEPVQEAEALPWINAFLAPEPVDTPSDQADHAPYGGAVAAEAERADDWPFSEAGAAASELSSELSSREPFAEPLLSSAPESLPMWNDDDMMDIMPVRAADPAPDATADSQSENAGHRAGLELQQESAARALETLASRVRGGELVLPGYSPEMGDAAALAAALAALLGSRR